MSYEVESFKVIATLTAQRIVSALSSTANTVEYPPAITSGSPFIGATTNDVPDTTQSIPVKTHGIVKLYFNDTCTSGKYVTADTSGRAIPFVAATAPSQYFGILIGPTVAATGTVADVLIRIGETVKSDNA